MKIKQTVKKILGSELSHKIGMELRFHQNPKLRGLIGNNIEFKNKHKGKRCFIFGNGPSLKNVDFSLFENEYTITVNQLPKNSNFGQLKTTYHVWADENFFRLDKNKPEDMELLQIMKRVNSENNKPIVFYKDTAESMVKKYSLDKELDIRYYAEGCWETWNANNYFKFNELVPGFATVIQYCICLAVYMGFSKIYLLGCDCTGIINVIESWLNLDDSGDQRLLYAYEISENQKKISQRRNITYSIKEELLDSIKLFEDYERLRDYCLDKNVKLYNATVPSLLQSIEKVNLEDLFRR